MLEIPNSAPIPLEEAQRLVLSAVQPLTVTRIPISEAHGYCLAEKLTAVHDVPQYDRSSVDGYALQVKDVRMANRSNPVKLHCLEEIPAGVIPTKTILPGTASRIMTGAPIPKGATAVVKVEESKIAEDGTGDIWIYQSVSSGEAITRKGEDMAKGTMLLPEGTLLGPVEVGLLALFGVSSVLVHVKPKVSILSTGSELVAADQPLSPGKHRDSNGVMLAGQIREAGGNPTYLRIVKDDPDLLAEQMLKALQKADVLVTSGGVSMGDYDYLGLAFEKIGAKVIFWKTLVRPGMPVLFGMWHHKPIFALAGNPASSYVNARLYLLPAIRRICGWRDPLSKHVMARCDERIEAKQMPHTRFLRGFVYTSQTGELRVKIAAKQSSNVLSSFLESNCLVKIPGGQGFEADEPVEVELLGTLGERVGMGTV
ncbi:molybdopterin molybdotransferase MoeA [Paenibacillus abyssi]|uniref:Molybdopterin molybdenumtransferase n=1 Tax=Paenibacillus abyssi TaxID=1340531 RepID=A0A917D7F9_9BACL|nr:gephyrin-like molybdotransferase Glp [Paenibacillus abyssi]GGG13677.1 molybdopterin molybdenumtransferase [Paenibacillus abyssi]